VPRRHRRRLNPPPKENPMTTAMTQLTEARELLKRLDLYPSPLVIDATALERALRATVAAIDRLTADRDQLTVLATSLYARLYQLPIADLGPTVGLPVRAWLHDVAPLLAALIDATPTTETGADR
jgi:hypothetical protein